MDNQATTIRQLSLLTWEDVRSDVLKVNEDLVKIIDDISPGKEYKFIKVSYLYGDIFVNRGKLRLPVNDRLLPLTDPAIDKTIAKELSYSSVPLFLMLEKSSEIYFDTFKRIIPINLLHKGDLSGTYEVVDYALGRTSAPIIWNFSIGSRSIFMVPKITNKGSLKKLHSLYNIPSTISVKRLSDHWEMFRNIAQNKDITQSWQGNVLLFGVKWFDNIIKPPTKSWAKFTSYLFNKILSHVDCTLEKVKFNTYWESLAEVISARRLHPKPYLFNQIKHLLAIGAGNFPAFTVMDDSQESAPSDWIKKVIFENYALKQYMPTLMHACLPIDPVIKPRYVYYSLSMPTISEGSPLKKTTSTIINDMREIKLIIETLQNRFKASQYHAMSNIIEDIKIDYFHYKGDIYNQVRNSSIIPLEDDSFLRDKAAFPLREFCSTSPFFSGCVRIGANKQT